MSDATSKPSLVRAAEHPSHGDYKWSFSHPLNPASQVEGFALSRIAGLTRAALNLMRVPPGKESFAYHRHAAEEEWIYILSGRGIAEIGDETFEVGPGDFMGFATPGVPHLLKNTSSEEIVYLMGGDNPPLDVLDYPKLGKRFLVKGSEFFELKDPTTPFGRVKEEGK